jgi:hypothetical protein
MCSAVNVKRDRGNGINEVVKQMQLLLTSDAGAVVGNGAAGGACCGAEGEGQRDANGTMVVALDYITKVAVYRH